MAVNPAPPEDLWSGLDSATPIALLPLRLETRYGTRVAAAADGTPVVVPVLRVRIYPDDLSVVDSAEGLSKAERIAGAEFWRSQTLDLLNPTERADWEAREEALPGTLAHRAAAGWEVLVRSVGRTRAEYVARSCASDAPVPPDRVSASRVARMLPDSWVITGTLDGAQVFVTHILRPGADPRVGRTRGSLKHDDLLLVAPDDETRWLTDFQAAVDIGMAAVIDLASVEDAAAGNLPPVVRRGVDTLVVVGVDDAQDPGQQADRLTDLITGHIDGDRAEFLKPGTATNNLADDSSGWTASSDVFSGYARVLPRPTAVTPLDAGDVPVLQGGGTDGEILTAALGLPAAALTRVPGAGNRTQWHARNMSVALFPVTLGEVIGTLNRPADEPFDPKQARKVLTSVIPFAREHMASFVRGRGPLPALRLGRQPYGFLPITSWNRWQPRPSEPAHLDKLGQILRVLRPVWAQAATGVAALTADTANSPLLARILGHGPVPHPGAYQVRDAAGMAASFIDAVPGVEHAAPEPDSLPGIMTAVAAQPWLSQQIQTVAIRQLYALTLGDLLRYGQLQHMSIQDEPDRMTVAVARSDEHRPDGWATPAEYLRKLAHRHAPAEHKPTDLLFVLVEHALARAGELDVQEILDIFDEVRFTGLLSVSPEVASSALSAGAAAKQTYQTKVFDLTSVSAKKDALAADEVGVQLADMTVTDLVTAANRAQLVDRIIQFVEVGPQDKDRTPGYEGTRTAVQNLAEEGAPDRDAPLTDADYTRLTGETLACAATRLDAWLTSIAAQRLASLREDRPTGVHVGAWGLLVGVRPGVQIAAGAAVGEHWPNTVVEQLPQGWAESLTKLADGPPVLLRPDRQVGYVQAPSLAHAVTGGVLRAAELAHRGDGSSLASIDLTSARVRLAREVLQGLSNGQSLGALLGYRLERSLAANGHNDAIVRLRAAYPQRRTAGDFGEPASGADAVTPADVVDGHEVLTKRAAAAKHCELQGDKDFEAAVDDLQRVVDALADVVVAEGVHGMVTGRPAASGAVFTATAEALQLPELTVDTEPRFGATLTDRIIIGIADTDDAALTGWRETPRARLAPYAERWARSVLGPATQWRVTVGDNVVGLESLGVCALDVLVETRFDGAAPAAEGVREQPVRRFDARFGGTAPTGTDYARLVALAGAAYDVLAGCRPLLEADVRLPAGAEGHFEELDQYHYPPVDPPRAAQLGDIRQAVVAAVGELETAITAVIDAANAADPADQDLATPMKVFAEYGLPGSRPPGQPTLEDVVNAASAAGAVLREVDAALATGLNTVPPIPAPAEARRADLVEIIADHDDLQTLVAVSRCIGGEAVLPTIAVRSDLAGAHLAEVTGDRAEQWLTTMTRVRRKLACFDDLRLFVEAGGGQPAPLSVHQLPVRAPEDSVGWFGEPTLKYPVGDDHSPLRKYPPLQGVNVHLVAAGPAAVLAQQQLHGFVVDDVVETLPTDTVDTGLALHYDAPNARPPQSVLLAVHPDPATPWDWRLLVEIAQEALSLAKIRGVELNDLHGSAIDEFFPLTYVRNDTDPNTTDLDVLTRLLIWLPAAVNAFRWMAKG